MSIPDRENDLGAADVPERCAFCLNVPIIVCSRKGCRKPLCVDHVVEYCPSRGVPCRTASRCPTGLIRCPDCSGAGSDDDLLYSALDAILTRLKNGDW